MAGSNVPRTSDPIPMCKEFYPRARQGEKMTAKSGRSLKNTKFKCPYADKVKGYRVSSGIAQHGSLLEIKLPLCKTMVNLSQGGCLNFKWSTQIDAANLRKQIFCLEWGSLHLEEGWYRFTFCCVTGPLFPRPFLHIAVSGLLHNEAFHTGTEIWFTGSGSPIQIQCGLTWAQFTQHADYVRFTDRLDFTHCQAAQHSAWIQITAVWRESGFWIWISDLLWSQIQGPVWRVSLWSVFL